MATLAGKILSGLDVEMGRYAPTSNATAIARHRRKIAKRTLFRTPIAVALSALSVFLFFVWVGSHRAASRTTNKSDDKLLKTRIDVGQPNMFTFVIAKEFDHDPEAFTQGLLYEEKCDKNGKNCKDIFYESTGLYGQSTVREVELTTGKVVRKKALPKSDFGEGLTRLGDRLYQVTWQTPKMWSYDVENFEDAKLLKTPLTDGWGITSNGTHLIVGDSTEFLYFLDPKTLEVVEKLRVLDNGAPVRWINELEYIDGLIYGNIYYTECIAQIDSTTGGVVGWVDMHGLKSHMLKGTSEDIARRADVLNGIAWDDAHGRLFVTGKQWPKMYQVELRPKITDATDPSVPEVLEGLRKKCIMKGGPVGR